MYKKFKCNILQFYYVTYFELIKKSMAQYISRFSISRGYIFPPAGCILVFLCLIARLTWKIFYIKTDENLLRVNF